jgi:hypothetical protein
LIFSRSFDGRQEHKSYTELLQKFSHLFDLHYVPERSAYCKYDKRGDIEDIVRVIEVPGEGDRWGGRVVTIDRTTLDEYLALTDAAIIRVFDFTRFQPKNFNGWNSERECASNQGEFSALKMSIFAGLPKTVSSPKSTELRRKKPNRDRFQPS